MSRRITVSNGETPIYDIVLETSFDGLAEEVEKISSSTGHKICVVADSTVAELYLEAVKSALQGCGSQVISFVFPAGEEYKNLNVVRDLYEQLILAQFDRKDLLVALGGGVTGDLTGFAAATYLRGIDFIQIPTTLLAQVDSSVGGKTGVDFDQYKNMVGAFHMPKLVYMNLSVLRTLPERIYRSGLGEVIKYGFITDAPFYEWLEANRQAVLDKEPEALEYMVYRSCENKRVVVEEDPTEKGRRALLNFGHTLGHAIEKQMDFALYHGECVALGMAAALWISQEKGYISAETVEEGIRLIQSFHLPVSMAEVRETNQLAREAADGLDRAQVLQATKNDKKMDAGAIRFILLAQVGDAVIDKTVTMEEMAAGLQAIGL